MDLSLEEKNEYIEGIQRKNKKFRKKWESAKYQNINVFKRSSAKANKRQLQELMEHSRSMMSGVGAFVEDEAMSGRLGVDVSVIAEGRQLIEEIKILLAKFEAAESNEELFVIQERMRVKRHNLLAVFCEFIRAC